MEMGIYFKMTNEVSSGWVGEWGVWILTMLDDPKQCINHKKPHLPCRLYIDPTAVYKEELRAPFVSNRWQVSDALCFINKLVSILSLGHICEEDFLNNYYLVL